MMIYASVYLTFIFSISIHIIKFSVFKPYVRANININISENKTLE